MFMTKFATNEDKLNFSSDILLDRVINLKLKCASKNEKGEIISIDEFVIRSDYEIVTVGENVLSKPNEHRKYIIRRCIHKPSIKVQCNMVTAETGTSIDVFVSNFFIFTSDGQHLRNFSSDKYQVIGVEIAMGYWGQFKNTVDINDINTFFDIKAINGADKITISNVTYVTTDKLPPDSVIHIKGFVGSVLSSPIALPTIKSVDEALSKPTVTSDSKLKDLFFNEITRRYTKSAFTKNGINALGIKDGMMSKESANKNGVRVYLTKSVENLKINSKPDSDGNKVVSKVYYESRYTIGQTISAIISALDSGLTYRFTNKGDLLIMNISESSNAIDMNKQFEEEMKLYADEPFEKIYKNELPAVYNINIDAVATIVCPFFTFIEPFQKIKFASKYALTSLVSYFADYNTNINEFIVIKVSLSFATVDNVNEVQITAVGIKG